MVLGAIISLKKRGGEKKGYLGKYIEYTPARYTSYKRLTVLRFFMPSYPPMAQSLSMSATRATRLRVTFMLCTYDQLKIIHSFIHSLVIIY